MEKNNGLIDVIEELLEADMTAPKKVRNPQNKMSEEDQVDEAQDKTDKSLAANKLTDTAKPKSDQEGDNSSEVIGSEKGAALDAGGDKDVGDMNKGKIASAASDNSKEVIGSEKGAALDSGADKDAGPKKDGKKAFPSDASSEVEANKGPHNQAMDEDAETMEWDWDKIDNLSEDDFQELVDSLTEEELAEFKERYDSVVVEEDEIEEGQDTSIKKNSNDDHIPDEEKESMKNMKEADDDSDDDDDEDDDDKEETDESVQVDEMELAHSSKGIAAAHKAGLKINHNDMQQPTGNTPGSKPHSKPDITVHYERGDKAHRDGSSGVTLHTAAAKKHSSHFPKHVEEEMEWDWEKIEGLTEDEFHDFYSNLTEEEQAEIEAHYQEVTEAKDKGDMDGDGKDEPDDKEYMDNKDKAIKKAMASEEKHDDDSDDDDTDSDDDDDDDKKDMEEATGEKLEASPSSAENEGMRPKDEKGKNEPTSKGGNPGEGPHDQSKDPIDTPTKANPKGPVKEDANELMEDLDEDFKEKASVIFETAVNEKANKLAEEIEAKYVDELEEEVKKINEKVDQYVDYVVNEWLEENQLEIKYSLRTEIAENFIREMKTVFESNFIDIPEEEVSVVDELTEAVESYKEQLDEQAGELESAKRELLEIKRKEIVDEVSNDLTQTQKIRLENLSENVEADDIEEFRYKVEQLKEGYFNESSEQPLLSSLSEEVFGGTVIEEDDSTVSQYAKFLSKTVNN